MKKFLLLFLSLGLVLTNCKKNDDVTTPDDSKTPEEETPVVKSVEDYPVQDFMWRAMNLYYFYQSDAPNLSDTKFASLDDIEYVDFISSEANPENFYFDKLVFSEDRFSFLNQDYKVLTQGFSGISKSNGLEFGLSRFMNSDVIYGYVRYVVKNSNASTKDIKRGDIFTAVDGTDLFFNSSSDNNLDLLFGDNDTYTLGMAEFVNGEISSTDKEVTLTKEEALFEDPIHVSKTLDLGDKKVGYLMYNQFAGNSGNPLNNVFSEFKSSGVTDLVLDLRYNPGGFSNITQILGSLIYGTNTEDVFYNRRFNAKYEAAFEIEGGFKTYFVADTGGDDEDNSTPLNSLNLKKIYVIATGNSASASELLINGLRPYLEVVHIGSTTVGKNQGSFTLVDSPATGYSFIPNRADEINPNNQWAIQPITSQTENSEGFGDYSDGLAPEILLEEDIEELGVLGDPTERMLARALQEMNEASSKSDLTAKFPIDLITSSSLQKAKGGELIFRNMPHTSTKEFKLNVK